MVGKNVAVPAKNIYIASPELNFNCVSALCLPLMHSHKLNLGNKMLPHCNTGAQ